METPITLHDTPKSKDGRWLVTTPGPDEGDPEVLRGIEIIQRVNTFILLPRVPDDSIMQYAIRIYEIHEKDIETVMNREKSSEEQSMYNKTI